MIWLAADVTSAFRVILNALQSVQMNNAMPLADCRLPIAGQHRVLRSQRASGGDGATTVELKGYAPINGEASGFLAPW